MSLKNTCSQLQPSYVEAKVMFALHLSLVPWHNWRLSNAFAPVAPAGIHWSLFCILLLARISHLGVRVFLPNAVAALFMLALHPTSVLTTLDLLCWTRSLMVSCLPGGTVRYFPLHQGTLRQDSSRNAVDSPLELHARAHFPPESSWWNIWFWVWIVFCRSFSDGFISVFVWAAWRLRSCWKALRCDTAFPFATSFLHELQIHILWPTVHAVVFLQCCVRAVRCCVSFANLKFLCPPWKKQTSEKMGTNCSFALFLSVVLVWLCEEKLMIAEKIMQITDKCY